MLGNSLTRSGTSARAALTQYEQEMKRLYEEKRATGSVEDAAYRENGTETSTQQTRGGGFGGGGFGGGPKKYDLGTQLEHSGKLFLNGVANAGSSLWSTAEDVLNMLSSAVVDVMNGEKLGTDYQRLKAANGGEGWGFGHMVDKSVKRETEQNREALRENAEGIRTGNETADKILRGASTGAGDVSFALGGALPMAAEAMVTGGASLAGGVASSTDDLVRMGARAVEKSGLLQTASDALRRTLTSRAYWTAFASEVGQDYQEKLAQGYSEDEALRYAVPTALVNSLIEVGGGIQKPGEAADGFLRTIGRVAKDEAIEEAEQGVVSRGMENLTLGADNPAFSLTDERAIINPVTSAKEAAMGGLVGAILGGGQQLIGRGAQALTDAHSGDATGAGDTSSARSAGTFPSRGRLADGAQPSTQGEGGQNAPPLNRASRIGAAEGNLTTGEENAVTGQETAPTASFSDPLTRAIFGENKNAASQEATEPVHAGRATTIYRPYRGAVPVQSAATGATVAVPAATLARAQANIESAQRSAASGGRGFKRFLRDLYEKNFHHRSVAVSDVSFDGQPYLVEIGRGVPGKVVNDKNTSAQKLAVLDMLDDVVYNAEYVGSSEYVAKPDGKQRDVIRYDYFETPVEIDDTPYVVSFDVEVFPNTNNYRTHRINEIELSPAPTADPGPEPGAIGGETTLLSDNTIPQVSEVVKRGNAAEEITADGVNVPGELGNTVGGAQAGFTTLPQGEERTSRLADTSMRYNRMEGEATALTEEEYNERLMRYRARTNSQSVEEAMSRLYIQDGDGRRLFLGDVDPDGYAELVETLRNAKTWTDVDVDTAMLIRERMQGQALEMEITEDEYAGWLNVIREHATDTGRGVQAFSKWNGNAPDAGARAEADAWDALQQTNLTEEERADLFRRIVLWDRRIESAQSDEELRQVIMEISEERGVLNAAVSNRQSRLLRRLAQQGLEVMDTDQLRGLAYAASSALTRDRQDTNAGRMVKTVQVLNMLSNPKTAMRNLEGNTTAYALDAMAMRGGALLDMALAKITGTRSMAFERSALSAETRAAVMQAIRMSAAEITLDVDMGGRGRYGTGGNRTAKANGSGIFNTGTGADRLAERVVSALERNMGYVLTTSDEAFKGAARATQSRTQELIDQGKIRTTDEHYAAERAEDLAQYRTFQTAGKAATAVGLIRDVLNMIGFGEGRVMVTTSRGKQIRTHSFGLGDIAAPFAKVAANLSAIGADYSPIGAVKGAAEIIGVLHAAARGSDVDARRQYKAVSDTARGLTGTALIAVFAALAQAGIIQRPDDDGDEDVAKLNASEGRSGTQINVDAFARALRGEDAAWQRGDELLALDSLEPINYLVTMGCLLARQEDDGLISRYMTEDTPAALHTAVRTGEAATQALLQAAGDLPVASTAGDLMKDVAVYGKDPVLSLIYRGGRTAVSSVTPNVLAAAAKGLDSKQRSTTSRGTDDLWSVIQSLGDYGRGRVPGLREELPTVVNTLGEESTVPGSAAERIINAMLNPITVNEYAQSDVSREMERVRSATGESGFYPQTKKPSSMSYTDKAGEKHEYALDYEQRQQFQTTYSKTMMDAMQGMIASRGYQTASDEEKAELLDICRQYGHQTARGEVIGAGNVYAWVRKVAAASNTAAALYDYWQGKR